MNPNHMPYGQPMPMQQPHRRHDGSYTPMPPQMRPHPGYQQYYPQQMSPMMPQYPQHFAPNWYPYPQHHIHPMQQPRPQYYQQPPIPPSAQYQQHHGGPLVVSSQLSHPQTPTRSQQTPTTSLPQQYPVSTAATPSAPVQTPPSPPLSTSTSISAKKDVSSQPASPAPQQVQTPSAEPVLPEERFFPPVPWVSVEGEPFPPRAARQRRRILRSRLAAEPVVYPLADPDPRTEAQPAAATTSHEASAVNERQEDLARVPTPVQTPTPLASDGHSDTLSTQPTTPLSTAQGSQAKSLQTPTQPKSRPVLPIVPAVPTLPLSPTAKRTRMDSSTSSQPIDDAANADNARRPSTTSQTTQVEKSDSTADELKAAAQPSQPKSWANLFRPTQPQSESMATQSLTPSINGATSGKSEALSDVLNEMNDHVETPNKLAFLTPRGLVNTGNMCYMNSVLQVLVFCTPFYDFVSKVARRAVHSFKSDTPLIDAIMLFIQEYPVIDSATSADQLRMRLKPEDLEKYGDSFIPEYVYAAIKPLPRFKEMRRGHQQDAQEFLGFLLEELHEECARAMRSGTSVSSDKSNPSGSAPADSEQVENETGWMEVGHKQKPSVTRSSGAIATESPVTNIFGGKLRSELKISGNKLSVTLEPYSPLQLDIGSPEVSNIIDALKGLTRPESMQGDFQSARGSRTTATKQVFIETLPPVLILHLKRFHYDNTTKRAEKIWKKVGYPLDLELPKEVFPVSARNKYAAHGGSPKYRLIGVIYHHGKNANGGHYTVDIRRQDEREWIRIDDTKIRRIRSEDVAEGGSEEDPKVLAAALERHDRQANLTGSRFEQIDQEGEAADESDNVWSQVNGHSRSKSGLSIANGAGPSAKTSAPQTPKYVVKDDKVAYLLFYQRI